MSVNTPSLHCSREAHYVSVADISLIIIRWTKKVEHHYMLAVRVELSLSLSRSLCHYDH